MYAHVDAIEKYIGQKITRLKCEHDYEYFLYEKPITKGKNMGNKGYGWTKMNNRWCTLNLKTNLIKNYVKQYTDKGIEVHQYVGIAYDEPKRIKAEPNKHYPLFDWKITEAEALQYCYDKGFDFGGLYNHFGRLGCYLCPLQSLSDLYNLYKHYPAKWQELLAIERKMYENIEYSDLSKISPFSNRHMVHDLDGRFKMQSIIDKRMGV